MTVKETQSGTIETLVEELQKELERLGRHIFNINHQYKALSNIKENIKSDAVLLHIDFSENYNCKYESEIQSTHFGASKRQISIHTGVAYTHDKTISFATVSDCLKHGPAAIWAHLDPVLKYLQSSNDVPLKLIHLVSDGPTTQYRSKTNFYFFSKKIYEHGFEGGTWNFWESGHGKGAPDGIGAVVKRQADELVTTKQHDVMKASDIVEGLAERGTTVKYFEITEEQIATVEQEIPSSIKVVRNTMKIHQVTTTEKYKIRSRILSCADSCQLNCACFDPDETIFRTEETTHRETDSSEAVTIQECGPVASMSGAPTDVEQFEKNTVLLKVNEVDESLIGRYCVVEYDGLPYPGIILDVDEDDLEVKVMHRIGVNRFFWPLLEDRLWYKKSKVLALLSEEPQQVTKRHCQIDQVVWKAITDEMDIE